MSLSCRNIPAMSRLGRLSAASLRTLGSPFGGVRASGFGVTRGEEGLLEMTSPHVVAVRHGTSRPHFDEPRAGDEQIFSSYILAAHGRGRQRLGAVRDLVDALLERTRNRGRNP